MRVPRVPLVSAAIAHALTWAIVLFLLFGPAYQGVTSEAALPGESPGETVRSTSTFVEVNGLYVLALPLALVVLTGLAFPALLVYRQRTAMRMAVLWGSVIALTGFCFLTIYSIGLLYVPVAVALFVAALADLAHRPGEA